MAVRRYVTFSDFRGGEAGRSRPAERNQYRGVNTWIYPSGALGPRPPVQPMGLTGMPTGLDVRTFNSLRVLLSGDFLIFTHDTKEAYRVPIAFGAAAVNIGSVPFQWTDATQIGDQIVGCSVNGNGAYIGTTGAPVSIPDMPIGSFIVEYLNATVLLSDIFSGINAYPTIQFSAPQDALTWPVWNTRFVGTQGLGTGLAVQRNTLVVPKIDGEVWQFSGVLGVDDVLRKVDKTGTRWNDFASDSSTVNESNIWWTDGPQMGIFTGSSSHLVPRPDIPSPDPSDTDWLVDPWNTNAGHVVPMSGDNEFAVVGTVNRRTAATQHHLWMHTYHNGRWNRHVIPGTEFEYDSPPNAGSPDAQVSAFGARATNVGDGVTLIATASSSVDAASEMEVFFWYHRQEYPYLPLGTTLHFGASVANTHADGNSGIPVIADATLSEWWAPDGQEVSVREVIVDYSYNPNIDPVGGESAHRVDISVDSLQRFGEGGVLGSSTIQFSPSASGTSADGSPMIRARQNFPFGDQGPGGGFRISLADWRGIMVHEVTAVIDLQIARN